MLTEHSQITNITELTQIQAQTALPFTASEILKNIKERIWFVLLVLLVSISVTFIYNETQTPLFSTRSVIDITLANNKNIDLPNQGVEYEDFYARQSRMETHIQVMRSSAVIKRLLNEPEITQRLSLEKPKSENHLNLITDLKTKISNLIHPAESKKPAKPIADQANADNEASISRFQHAISANIIPDTNLIELNAIDRNPKIATAIVNLLPKVYKEYLLENKLTGVRESLDWMTQELTKLKSSIHTSLGNAEVFSSQTNILAFEQSPEFIQKEIGKMRSELNDVQTKNIELSAQIDELKKVLTFDDKYIPGFLQSDVLSQINLNLVQKKLELGTLLETFKDKHPDVMTKKSEIGFLLAEFNLQLKKALSSLESQQTVYKTKEAALDTLINKYKSLITNQAGSGTDLNIIQDEIETDKELYQLILKQMKTANLTEAFVKEDVHTVELAKEPFSPFKPAKVNNLILAVLGGLFAGLSLAAFLGYIEAKVMAEDDIENYFNVPVLGIIPKIKNQDLISRHG